MNQMLRDAVMKLPADERAELAQELWESLEPEQHPEITAEEIAILEERLAEHRAHPEWAIPAETVMAELRSKLR